MDIRHNRWTTRTELESVISRWIYFHLRSKIFFLALLRGGGRSQNARVQIALANHTLGNRVWATFLSVPTGRYGLGPQSHYFFSFFLFLHFFSCRFRAVD